MELTGSAKRYAESHSCCKSAGACILEGVSVTHKAPVSHGKKSSQGIKWDVAPRTFGVVVRARKLCSSSLKVPPCYNGGLGRRTKSSAGEHL